MREDLEDSMDPILDRITEKIAATNPRDLVRRGALEAQVSNFRGLAATQMKSPAQEVKFLLSVLLNTAADGDRQLDESDWAELLVDVHEIYRLYQLMHFPPPDPDVPFPEDPAELTGVTLQAFTDYHYTALLATREQRRERLRRFYGPVDGALRKEVGHDIDEILDAISYVEDCWNNGIYEGSANMTRTRKELRRALSHLESLIPSDASGHRTALEEIRAAGSLPVALSNVVAISRELKEERRRQFEVPRASLEKGSAPSAVTWLVDTLAASPEHQADPTYPTGEMPADRTPLLDVSEHGYGLVHPGYLYPAVESHLEEAIEAAGVKERASEKRGEALEQAVQEVIGQFLNEVTVETEVEALWSVCEDASGNYEHDGLVRIGSAFVVIEDKASPLGEVFRDPEKAYERIRGDFRDESGPQHAYNQALRLRDELQKSGGTTLYDRDGNPVLRTEEGADEVHIVCVVDQTYRVLGANHDLLLDRDDGDPPPFMIPFEDLETLLWGFRRLGRAADELLRFLREHAQVSPLISTSDHLDTVTLFLARDNLSFIADLCEDEGADEITISPTFSRFFDLLAQGAHQEAREMLEDIAEDFDTLEAREMFRKQVRGGFLALPDGSNPWWESDPEDPCPCRSGRAYGDCHGPLMHPDEG